MDVSKDKGGTTGLLRSLAFWQKKPVALDWEKDICPMLPEGISLVSAGDLIGKRAPVTAPWAQSSLHALTAAAPSIHSAVNSGRYLKIVGPPKALDGSTVFMHDKEGHILGSLVDPKSNKIAAQTRFEGAAGDLNAAATAAVTFQVLSVATSQYYLSQISDTLQKIEGKLDDLNFKIESQQYGEIKGALETIDEVYAGNLQHIQASGTVAWQPPERTEFWTRMAHAEHSLRTNCHALERELGRKIQGIVTKVTDKHGGRRRESYNEYRRIVGEVKGFQDSPEVELYLAAVRGLVQWYEVVLSFDAITWNGISKGRYHGMVNFVGARHEFLSGVWRQYGFVLDRPDGAGIWDRAITAGTTAVATLASVSSSGNPLTGMFVGKSVHEGRGQSFERDKKRLAGEVEEAAAPLLQIIAGFEVFDSSFRSPGEFYLKPGRLGSQDLELVLVQEQESVCA